MRFRVRKCAHVLERNGLAMAGAACGLFVAAHVGSTFSLLTSMEFVIGMMTVGAVGFYLGIDTPPLPFREPDGDIDVEEFFGAVGTFLATASAFASVLIVVLRDEPPAPATVAILMGWCAGIAMQIVAGALARRRPEPGIRSGSGAVQAP